MRNTIKFTSKMHHLHNFMVWKWLKKKESYLINKILLTKKNKQCFYFIYLQILIPLGVLIFIIFKSYIIIVKKAQL